MLRRKFLQLNVSRDISTWFLREYSALNHIHALILLRTLRKDNLGCNFRNESAKLSETVQLGITELVRSMHLLSRSELVDAISYLGEIRRQKVEFSDYDDLVLQALKYVGDLDGSKITLLLSGLVKLGHRHTSEFVCIIESLLTTYPDRISSLSRKNIVLLVWNCVKSISSCRGSSDVQVINRLTETLLHAGVFKNLSFQDSAMLLSSLGKLRRVNVDLKIDTAFIDRVVPNCMQGLQAANPNKSGLLAALWGLSLLNIKSQPVLIHLYRQVHARTDWSLDESCFLFFMFQTTSGILDESIRSKLIFQLRQNGSPSHTNILNALLGLSTCPPEMMNFFSKKHLVPQISSLKSDHLITAFSIVNSDDSIATALCDESLSRISNLNAKQLVRLFSLLPQNRLVESELVSRLKKKETIPPRELLLLATVVNRPNLKTRVAHLLKCAIENRAIPTPLLVEHLPLVSRLGVFHKLNFSTQKKIFAFRKQGVPIPKLTPKSHRHVNTSNRLVWLDETQKEEEEINEIKAIQKRNIQEEIWEDEYLEKKI